MYGSIVLDNLAQVTSSFQKIIPAIIGALLALLVGYVIAKIVQSATRGVLTKLRLDRRVDASSASIYVRRVTDSPSRAAGRLAYWIVMFFTISLSATILGVGGITRVVNVVYAYLPNVLAAALILVAAGIVAGVASRFATRALSGTATGKLVSGIVPAFVFSVAGFMVLSQLKIATPIVTITYAALIGAVALGAALAFGLGGREVAGRMLEQAYATGQERLPQMRSQMQAARQPAEEALSEQEGEVQPGTTGYSPLPSFGERLEEDADSQDKSDA